jgi:hypothetical protein
MNLAKIRPSFSSLSDDERLELILKIRNTRRFNAEAKAARVTRAAKKPGAPKHHKQANDSLLSMSPEQAAQLLALLGDT